MAGLPENKQIQALLDELPERVRAQALATLQRYVDRDPYTGPFGWQLGLHYTERAPGRTSCMIDVNESFYNPGGVAHGGVVFTLADSAMGAAVHTLLEPGQRCTTAELKLNYLAPVRHGKTTATATVISKRRRLAVVTAEVHDEQGELVALAQGTFAIIQVDAPRAIEGDS